MNIDVFKKLESKINNQSFSSEYKNIRYVLLFLSYFGNVSSIFLAYFMLSKILLGSIESQLFVFISSIIILSGLEILKRDIFNKFSYQFIKNNSLIKGTIPLFISSIIIISISFYASLSGAKEFSSKEITIENNSKDYLQKYSDSLSVVYNSKIKSINDEINNIKSKIETKDKEQTNIESIGINGKLNRNLLNRIRDIKDEKEYLRGDIDKLDGKVNSEKIEFENAIRSKKDEINLSKISEKSINKSNSISFIIISMLIEFIILAGIYFNEYYKYRSYSDFKKKIENDPSFQKWYNYNAVLDVIYNDDTKINDKISSIKNIQDICKVNGIILLNKDMIDLFKLFTSLGIIRSSGSSKYIGKSKEISQEILKKHFNID